MGQHMGWLDGRRKPSTMGLPYLGDPYILGLAGSAILRIVSHSKPRLLKLLPLPGGQHSQLLPRLQVGMAATEDHVTLPDP